jgi:hypothetical protein
VKTTTKLSIALPALLVALPACSSGERPEEPLGTTSQRVTSSDLSAVPASPVAGCPLNSPGGRIRHIIYVQFDNVHFTRDNPNVPSDLEQQSNLLDFITGNGTLLDHHHTPLISHTSNDILTSLTGVYPSSQGQAVANAYGFFPLPGTSTELDGFESSFEYWTDIVNAKTDPAFNMVTADGMNAPAPWVPYVRAGCNVGAVSTANMEFENITSDVTNVFGANSPEAAEAKSNKAQATADFEGISVHCAAGDAVCSSTNGGEPDVLPQEPGGYSGFSGLFGHKFVAPVISPGAPLVDLDGNVITDGNGHIGFPGFGPITASQSLGYVAAMQEHGIPITFAYISDAHDDPATELASGPGQADYVARLAAYNKAWGEFFARLKQDGITPDNTLFVITADEGDHFAGGPPSPANCDGVHVPCTYDKIGEVDINTTTLIDQVDPNLASTPFDIHFDMAPAFLIQGNPAVGSPLAREFERATAALTAVSPITGNTDKLTRYMADPVELKTLHMITGDPQRTPNFVMFANPDYFFQTSGAPVQEDPGFAWNHGGVDPKINRTWLGLVGPGVRHGGIDSAVWSDHTDIRPTMLVLAGLTDDYAHDGRALVEELESGALPAAVRSDDAAFRLLAATYKQITAPVGELGLKTLEVSTTALAGDDATYAKLEGQISALTTKRDALAGKMIQKLEDAEFHNQHIDLLSTLPLIAEAEALLVEVRGLGQ